MRGEFITDDQTWRSYLNANLEVLGEPPESSLLIYEWLTRFPIQRNLLLAPIQVWSFALWKVR